MTCQIAFGILARVRRIGPQVLARCIDPQVACGLADRDFRGRILWACGMIASD
jgi:hypothetical protein